MFTNIFVFLYSHVSSFGGFPQLRTEGPHGPTQHKHGDMLSAMWVRVRTFPRDRGTGQVFEDIMSYLLFIPKDVTTALPQSCVPGKWRMGSHSPLLLYIHVHTHTHMCAQGYWALNSLDQLEGRRRWPLPQCVKFKSVSVLSDQAWEAEKWEHTLRSGPLYKAPVKCPWSPGEMKADVNHLFVWHWVSGRRQKSRGARETRTETCPRKVGPGAKFSTPQSCSKGPPLGPPMLATECHRPPVGNFSHLVRWAPEALPHIHRMVVGFVLPEGWARGNCSNVTLNRHAYRPLRDVIFFCISQQMNFAR